MCEKCDEMERGWAQAIFDDEEFRTKLIRDLEIQHQFDGNFTFKGNIANQLVRFLAEQTEESGVEWEDDVTEEQKFESAQRVVCNFFDLIGDTQSHLAKFSLN